MSGNKSISGTFSADGNSSSIEVNRRAIAFIGSSGGTYFGSGTVTVQLQAPNGDWCSSQQTASSSDVLAIDVVIPTTVRLNLSGATTPDLDYSIQSDVTNIIE